MMDRKFSEPRLDNKSVSFFCGTITKLFLDYLTTDITDTEWNNLQDSLGDIVEMIKGSGNE